MTKKAQSHDRFMENVRQSSNIQESQMSARHEPLPGRNLTATARKKLRAFQTISMRRIKHTSPHHRRPLWEHKPAEAQAGCFPSLHRLHHPTHDSGGR